jgi:uncharacterized protein (DUF1501 family)
MKRYLTGCAGHRQNVYSRREALRIGSLGALGLSLGNVLRLEAAQKHYDSVEGSAKRVIQIILPGGVAAQESWNPKPEAPLEYRGPYGVVKTPIPGIVMSETLSQTAKLADKLTVIRSVVGKIPDHGQATYHMLRGYPMTPALKHPTVGTVVNHEYKRRNELPSYIAIGNSQGETGYLGSQYGPFTTGGDPAGGNFQVQDLVLPGGLSMEAFEGRMRMREAVNNEFRKLEANNAPLDSMDAYYKQAYEMISSQAVRDAFDLSKESEKLKQAYGKGMYEKAGSQAGLRMLLARRLVEAGARFVSLRYGRWDNHSQLKRAYDEQMPAFDHAFAALITDLEQRGLLDSTLVWVVSEFGRTPKFNQVAGRDHWSRVFSIAMAGGGLKKGLFYGNSDATSSDVDRNGVPLADLHATIYKLIGINSDKELMAAGNRPMEIIDGGKPVDALLA